MSETIKPTIKPIYFKITIYLMFANMLLAFTKDCIGQYMNVEEIAGQFTTFLCSQVGMIVINIITLMILKLCRKEPYTLAFFKTILKKIPFFIVLTFLLSLFQIALNLLFLPFSYIPYVYPIVTILLSTFFLLWNLVIVYRIVDGEQRILNILFEPLNLLKAHWKHLFLYAMPFLVWMFLGQQLLFTSLASFITDKNVYGNLLLSLSQGNTVSTNFIILFLYSVFYFLQFTFLVPLYMLTTVYYDETRTTKSKKKQPQAIQQRS